MDVQFNDITGGNQQFADTMYNVERGDFVQIAAPVVAEVRELRKLIDEAIRSGDVPEPTGVAVVGTLDAVDEELQTPAPRRGRVSALLQAAGLLTAGLTAGTGLAEAFSSALAVVSGAE